MDDHEPINELCVISILFHPVHGLLMSYTKNGTCMLTDACDVEVGDAWPETLQRSLHERFGSFHYEVLSLEKMETFSSDDLWETPRFGLFVICQTEAEIDLSKFEGECSWCNKDEEVDKTAYCHPLFRSIAQDVLKKYYPTQLQFSL